MAVDEEGAPATGTTSASVNGEETVRATPTLAVTVQNITVQAATQTPIPTATATPTPPPTNFPVATLATPPETPAGLAAWLGTAQAIGERLDDVCQVLQEQVWQQPADSCQAVDLDGDGQAAWLLTLDYTRLQPQEGAPMPLQGHPGDFWIVNGGQVVYRTQDLENVDFFGSAPQLFEVAEMTGDGQPDLITRFTTCGAHTCVGNYRIVSAHHGPIQNVVSLAETPERVGDPAEPPLIGMAYVEGERVEDVTGDGLPDLVLAGGLIGSAGAGIQRPRTEVWGWNGEAIALTETRWAETGYRFHTLYNANHAFAQGTYAVARRLYEQAIEDESLEEVDWPPSAEAVRAATRQFAAFRLTLLALLQDDLGAAGQWQSWLGQQYPQAPLATAASQLLQTWGDNGNDPAGACATVTAFLLAQDEPTGPLAYMGYGNPTLEAENVCPLE